MQVNVLFAYVQKELHDWNLSIDHISILPFQKSKTQLRAPYKDHSNKEYKL